MLHSLLLLRTVIHLRPRQVFFQALRRLQSRCPCPPSADRSLPDSERFALGAPPARLPSYAPVPEQDATKLIDGTFTFLNDTRHLGQPIAWEAASAPLLWRYNLHYFDWLWSLDLAHDEYWSFVRRAVLDWIRHLPPAAAAVGWAPYPTSLRLINWSLLLLGRGRTRLDADDELKTAVASSMWQQLDWLARRLEYQLLANHLLENAAALTLAAGCFTGRDARRWRAQGARLLKQELDEQLLADGCHYERSPMYHARVVWLLDALDAAERERAGQALALLRHPDGEIALLNDAATRVYGLPDHAATESSNGVWALPAAGYYGARTAAGEYLVVDAGPIGPDYQPGHAHADLLSFEWSLDGRRVITDTGVYEYQVGERRQYDRSTAAHNTVTIDGGDSCEVWGGFRVGRRVRPTVVAWEPAGDRFELVAQHAGFRGWIHRRRFAWQPGRLELTDTVTGRRAGVAVGRLHLAPEATVELTGPGRALVRLGTVQVVVEFEGSGTLALEQGWYSPQFGIRLQRPVLAYRMQANRETSWRTIAEKQAGE